MPQRRSTRSQRYPTTDEIEERANEHRDLYNEGENAELDDEGEEIAPTSGVASVSVAVTSMVTSADSTSYSPPPPNPFPQGATVQITAGPWAGEIGTVSIARDDKAKVVWPGCPRSGPNYWGVWVMHDCLQRHDPHAAVTVEGETDSAAN